MKLPPYSKTPSKMLWAFDMEDGTWMLITHLGRCDANTKQLKAILKAWIKSLDAKTDKP